MAHLEGWKPLYSKNEEDRLILVLVVISSRGTDGNEPNATSCSGSRHLSTEPESIVTEGEDYNIPVQLSSYVGKPLYFVFPLRACTV